MYFTKRHLAIKRGVFPSRAPAVMTVSSVRSYSFVRVGGLVILLMCTVLHTAHAIIVKIDVR
jgi:hypothetical protein